LIFSRIFEKLFRKVPLAAVDVVVGILHQAGGSAPLDPRIARRQLEQRGAIQQALRDAGAATDVVEGGYVQDSAVAEAEAELAPIPA
jgi:hypothetical protein